MNLYARQLSFRSHPLFGLLLLCLLSGMPGWLGAQTRFHRLFNAEDGLNPPAIRSLAQDRTGFLWIGTQGGLFRYDGVEMRRWAAGDLDRTIARVLASPTGLVVALEEGGRLYAITARGAEPVPGPQGRTMHGVRDAAFDRLGGLWVIRGDEVWNRSPDGRWRAVSIPLASNEHPILVRPHRGGQVHVATAHGVWRVGPTQTATRVLNGPVDVVDILTTRDGRVLVVTFLGVVLELTPSGPRELFRSDGLGAAGRAISIVERGEILWLAIDRYLVGWRPNRPPVVLGENDDLQSGGVLLVDHENSLWMGSFVGLYQFPEPDTEIWTERGGLPSNHVRYVARTGRTIWFTTWQGAGYLQMGPAGWEPGRVPGWTPTPPCVDSRNTLWAGSTRGLLEVDDRVIRNRLVPDALSVYDCHEGPDGRLWLGTDRGLLHLDPARRRVRSITTPFDESPPTIEAVLLDQDRVLWVASGEAVCRTAEPALLPEGNSAWSCESIPGALHVSGGGMIRTPHGVLLASSNRLGVVQRAKDRWEPVPELTGLPSHSILSLVPSRAGGVWLAGHGVLHRIAEAPYDSTKWSIEERLSYWHGLPGVSGTHLLETDGALWVTTSQGLARVPSESRYTVLDPPRVVLVDARVDDKPVALVSGLEFPHSRNHLELQFAALSFRDPLLVQYQVRLSPDEPWLDTAGQPRFRWVDLPPGEYRAEVRASLDGTTWSSSPAFFEFRVAPPWYREGWALALLVALVLVALYSIHRFRVGHLVELERQRTRIAMDLHDEIGSGLGSIGILSGMLAADGLDPREERRMIREIAATTGELGAALSQIVWALDPRTRTMEEVAARLAELGRRLFSGDTTEFVSRFPGRWPAERPSDSVRRNVVLIGIEALHNAARHSQASRVELRISAPRDGRWTLEVIDVGVGLRDSGEAAGGVGRRSMRRRAEEIGADLKWSTPSGGGTKVQLVFSAHGRSRSTARPTWSTILKRGVSRGSRLPPESVT